MFFSCCTISNRTWCQEQTGSDSTRNENILQSIVRFIAPLILPKIVQDVHLLREHIRSEEFSRLRLQHGDPAAVDEIFAKARELSWDNLYEALLISFVATIDHRRVGIQTPLIGPLFWFPLTSEFEDEFQDRMRALPRNLYTDTPKGKAGDRDKLQHFFGSAFVAFTFESKEAAERMGDAIELGEASFIVDGARDERDRRANSHGQAFGLSLLQRTDARPSMFLQLVTAERYSSSRDWDPESHLSDEMVPAFCAPQPRWQTFQREER